MYRFSFLLLILAMLGCRTTPSDVSELPEAERWAHRAAHTEIIRDNFGVPHVYGKTDADAVFGLLYAQCEDDFPRVERNYTWAIGRLAEVEGEAALYSDVRARLYMTRAEAEEALSNSPKWLQDLCIAFADGINYYLETHPEVEPKLLDHFEPWMPMFFSEGSIGGDIERVSTRNIQNFYGNQSSLSSLDTYDGLIRPRDDEPRGSNGFAIAGEKTESGDAMLLINPHTSFYFRGEVHMVSEEGLNAYGAVTWGQFFIYQGFNAHNGWMHTSTGTDIIDEFEETLVMGDDGGLNYLYGDEKRPIDSFSVDLDYRTATGEMAQRNFTLYRTHHGPITHANGDKWVATALMWDPVNALIQSYTRTKTKNHAAFKEMMTIRRNSSNNTVYADADGTIAYYHGNFIPKRDTSFDFSKPVDGSNPATDWQGLHTVDENILVVNPDNGWIQNCNSTPFTSAAENSPKRENYPYYMTNFPENFRGIHAIPLLEEANNLTLDKLITLAYDPYLPAMDAAATGLLKAFAEAPNPSEKVTQAIDLLDGWDFTVSKTSEAMTITWYYINTYLRSGLIPRETGSYVDQVYYIRDMSPMAERLEQLTIALQQLEDDFGSIQTPWGEVNRFQRLDGRIDQQFDDNQPSIPVGMASGRYGALASYGARRGADTKRIYGSSGNSFVAVVEFGEQVKAKTMLAGGQSGDPDSPHFADQAQRYADGQFKEAAYYRKDVLARAVSTYHPGDTE